MVKYWERQWFFFKKIKHKICLKSLLFPGSVTRLVQAVFAALQLMPGNVIYLDQPQICQNDV